MKIKIESTLKNVDIMRAAGIPHEAAINLIASTIVECESLNAIPGKYQGTNAIWSCNDIRHTVVSK